MTKGQRISKGLSSTLAPLTLVAVLMNAFAGRVGYALILVALFMVQFYYGFVCEWGNDEREKR